MNRVLLLIVARGLKAQSGYVIDKLRLVTSTRGDQLTTSGKSYRKPALT